MKKIVLTGGGTAGHVTPNIALLPSLKEAGYEVFYIGSYTGIEKTLIEDLGIPYYGISSGKLRRYRSLKNLSDPFRVLHGLFQAKRLMKKIKPDIKTIYILPTDLEVPKQKARQRNLSKEKEIERIKEIDEQYNKFMNDKDFQGKFDYILYNNYDSESEKQILDLVKNLIVNE